jgi:hypothetical protein
MSTIMLIFVFHGLILLFRKIMAKLITALQLHENILPPKKATPISEESLQSAGGQLKGFIKYARLGDETTDEIIEAYKIFTLKFYFGIRSFQ